MIYLLGASHLMAILDACAASGPPSAVPTFGQGQAPVFRECPLRDGVLPDRLMVASIHVSHIAPFWGPALVEMLPQGQLGIAAGFQALLASAQDDAKGQTLFVSLRGEEYFNLGLAGVEDPFDFVLPQRPDLAPVPGRALIPLEVVQEQLDRQLARTLLTLTAIRKLCPRLQVVRIPSPPPARSEDVAAWAATRDKPERAHKVPTSVRLKLWLLYDRQLAQCATGLGIDSLPVPEQAVHRLGTLGAEYLQDGIHGNARYGALVCAQMAQVVSRALKGAH
jgi:hypothetical protein